MRSFLLVAALTAAFPSSAQTTLQPEIVVTATRRAQTVDDTLATVSVITREDIARSQAPDLLTLLRGLPGVDLARTGGEGQSTSLFLRGSNSNQTLVLVDGVRIASANTGAAALEHLPLGQVERIEIVRGPRAAWYGSDAIGGVIQVFTRRAAGAAAQFSAGRWGRLEGNVQWQGGDERAGFGIGAGVADLDGFSARLPGAFGFDPDDDGYRNRNLLLRGHAELGAQRIGARVLATRADIDFDQGVSDNEATSGALDVEGTIGAGWRQRAVLGFHRESLATPVFESEFLTRRSSLDWTFDRDLGSAASLVAGLNWQRERGESLATGDVGATCTYCVSRRNLGFFASAQGAAGALDWQVAARHDDDSSFGGAGTGQAALGWRASESVRIFASWGEGFRAPNLNELYSPGFGGFFAGNPALDPERSRSLEAGIDLGIGAHRLGARAFRTRVRDLIAFQGGETFQAVNVARAALDGVELAWEWRAADWRLDASATWQDPRDETTDLDLLRRPARKAAFGAERTFGAWSAGAGLQYASSRRDFGGDLDAYTLLDLRLARELGGGWRIGARLDNALDREYELARGFATPARAWRLTIDWAQP